MRWSYIEFVIALKRKDWYCACGRGTATGREWTVAYDTGLNTNVNMNVKHSQLLELMA